MIETDPVTLMYDKVKEGQPVPFGFYARIKPNHHGVYSILDLPNETFEPP